MCLSSPDYESILVMSEALMRSQWHAHKNPCTRMSPRRVPDTIGALRSFASGGSLPSQ